MREKLDKYRMFTGTFMKRKSKNALFFQKMRSFEQIEPQFWKQLDEEVSQMFDEPELLDDKSQVLRFLN